MKQGKQLLKETETVEAELKGVGYRMMAEMEHQKKLVPVLEKRVNLLTAKIDKMRSTMEVRMSKRNKNDKASQSDAMIEEYTGMVYERDEAAKTLQMVEESIAEAETLYPGGIPTDQSVMGPEE